VPWEAACIFSTGEAMDWSPSSSTTLPQRHLELSRILAPVQRAIAIWSSSGLNKFLTLAVGNASDQVAVM